MNTPSSHPSSFLSRFILRCCSLLLLCCLLVVGYLAIDTYLFLTNPAAPEPQEIIISIEEGDTFDRVAWNLKKAGAITSVGKFRLFAWYKKSFNKIQAGEFAINTHWTPPQILSQITSGKPILYKLNLREGLTWWETARAIEEQGFAKFDDFKAVIFDPEFLATHNIPFANAEGFLFPDTYLLRKPKKLERAQAEAIAHLLVTTFWKKNKELWAELPMGELNLQKSEGFMGTAATFVVNATAKVMTSAVSSAIQGVNATQAENFTTAIGPISNNTTTTSADKNSESPASMGQSTTELTEDTETEQVTPQKINGKSPEDALAESNKAQATRVTQASTPLHPAELDIKALQRLIILASLIEKETSVASERAIVSGVYTNRLRINMLLQCDPTIPYGIGAEFTGPIRKSQLRDKSNPYNTYQNKGLPPGPISSFGVAALKAALNPKAHTFLYFVATGSGGHTFSKNLSEHQKAVQEYRRSQRR